MRLYYLIFDFFEQLFKGNSVRQSARNSRFFNEK